MIQPGDGIFGGYYYDMIAGLDDAARILYLDTSALKVIRDQIHRNKTTLVGIVKTTVLAPDFRGHTSSNMLMDILMNWFHDKNVRSILALSSSTHCYGEKKKLRSGVRSHSL